jgi:aryl carrier-like protein
MPKVETLSWKIVLRAEIADLNTDLPQEILTIAPTFRHDGMPFEVGLLLSTNMGPRQFLNEINLGPPENSNAILGLFLNDPLLNITTESARLLKSGYRWITNLPSVEQQDLDFSQQLSDVGLDKQREFDLLARLKSEGFKIAVVVADNEAASTVVKLNPEIIIVVPKVSDFAAGFPSPRQRGQAAQNIFQATKDLGWAGLLLGLGEHSEIDHESLWPNCLNGLLCRPKLTSA